MHHLHQSDGDQGVGGRGEGEGKSFTKRLMRLRLSKIEKEEYMGRGSYLCCLPLSKYTNGGEGVEG